MSDNVLKISSGLISFCLFASLILKLQHVPGGMILSGLFFGGMILVFILIACLPFTLLLNKILKKKSFLITYSILTSVAFLIFHYYLYSPTLKIIVPENYSGEIDLVLANVDDNILKVWIRSQALCISGA